MKPALDWKLTKQIYLGAATGAKSKNAAAEAGNRYHRKVYKTLELKAKLETQGGWELMVEPWFRAITPENRYKACSPDTVLVNHQCGVALVIEVKLNWRDGKDEKLIDLYLPVVKQALGLKLTRPLLITKNVRGLKHEPLVGLGAMWAALNWQPGLPTPVALVI